MHGGKDAIKRHWNDQAKRTAFVDVPIPQLSRDDRQPPSSDRVCHSARLKKDEGDIILRERVVIENSTRKMYQDVRKCRHATALQ